MSDLVAARSPKPQNRIVPGPEFVYPCRAWLEREPRGWEDVVNKMQQTEKELFRLERSIAFLSSQVPSQNNVAIASRTVQHCLPAVKASNYQRFDTALRALFEPLAPWTAAVLMDGREELEWEYCISKGLVQYLTLVQEDIQLHLPQNVARLLLVHTLQPAIRALAFDDHRARVFNDLETGSKTPQKRRMSGISQRWAEVKRHLFPRKNKPGEATIASEGNVIIFNSQNIQPGSS